MLVEKAQEFPALFLVNERKKDAKGIRIQSWGAHLGIFIYDKALRSACTMGEPLGQPLVSFYATIISNR